MGLAKMQLRNLSGKTWLCEARARRPFVRSAAYVCFCALGGTGATRGHDLCTSPAHTIATSCLSGPGPPKAPESDRASLLMGVNNLGVFRIFPRQSSLPADDGRSQRGCIEGSSRFTHLMADVLLPTGLTGRGLITGNSAWLLTRAPFWITPRGTKTQRAESTQNKPSRANSSNHR